jgi:hypothetical protein
VAASTPEAHAAVGALAVVEAADLRVIDAAASLPEIETARAGLAVAVDLALVDAPLLDGVDVEHAADAAYERRGAIGVERAVALGLELTCTEPFLIDDARRRDRAVRGRNGDCEVPLACRAERCRKECPPERLELGAQSIPPSPTRRLAIRRLAIRDECPPVETRGVRLRANVASFQGASPISSSAKSRLKETHLGTGSRR